MNHLQLWIVDVIEMAYHIFLMMSPIILPWAIWEILCKLI